MKPFFKYYLLATFLLSTFAAIGQERITNFAVQLRIDTSNTMTVQERISIVAEGIQFKRGIIRNIPYSRADVNGDLFKNPIKILSVEQDGAEAEYKQNDKSGRLEIKIGNANKYLSAGAHQYIITYQIKNQVGFFENYDEIYWNVTGTEWNFYIDTASCEVILPSAAQQVQAACYTGIKGSKDQNCYNNKGVFSAYGLQSNEGLTIALGFTKGVVKPPPPPSITEQYGVLALAIAFMLGILGYMAHTWRKYGKDPIKPTVIPQFKVPQNLSPAQLGFYNKKQFRQELFTVAIISLATKGYITITEKTTKTLFIFKDTDYTISKIKEDEKGVLPNEEAAIMNSLFSRGKNSITADGKYQAKFLTAKTKFSDSFNEEIKTVSSENNRRFLWIPFLLVIAFWAVISFYNFASVFLSAIAIFVLLALPFFLSLPIFIFATVFKAHPKFSLVYKSILVLATGICISIVLLDTTTFNFNTKCVLIFSLMALLVYIAYQFLIKRPSEATVQLQADIEGFTMYMKTAEEQQLQMFNSPAMTPALFEELLPYAMALGIEKIWGKKFQAAVDKGMIDGSYTPVWYQGSHWNTANFSGITNSIASSISQSSTAPSSSGSGSGWSSGSSGGGSSGGGGGGGGGGGW